uniref:Uncharacterized protein n=1 Tax=Aegilops tauschii subsp. strangulata TaxID=200361 RepID=A0A453CK43_AEGTS
DDDCSFSPCNSSRAIPLFIDSFCVIRASLLSPKPAKEAEGVAGRASKSLRNIGVHRRVKAKNCTSM